MKIIKRHLQFLSALLVFNNIFLEATLGVSNAQAQIIGIQNNGEFLVAGSVTINGIPQYMLARYTAFGTIDLSYGNYGYVATPIGTNSAANGLAILSNNQPVVVGLAQLAPGDEFAIARYNVDGTLDATFNNTGIVTTSIGAGACAYNIIEDSIGRYIIAGVSVIGGAPIVTVARYNVNGIIDFTFGNNGIAIKRIFASSGAYALGLQSTGKIITAGFTINSGKREFALVRFNTNGSVDATFNGSGSIVTPIGADACAYALAIQSNDRIIAAGVSNNQFALVRYTGSGSPDTSFGSGGIVTTRIGSTAQINDIVLQNNGLIVVAGFSDNQFAVARYNANGSIDTTFGNAGIVTTALGISAMATSIVVQENGQIVVAGTSDAGVVLVRYNSNGSIDASFGTNGIINFPNSYNAPDIFGITNVNIANNAQIDYSKLNLSNSIMNSDISAQAAIANNKLAPLSLAGTVFNSATTATSLDVPGTIIARDTFGNFNANMIFGDVTGDLIGSASDNLLKSGDTMSGVLVLPAGSAAVPSLQFSGSKKTGLSAVADTVSISTKGVERVAIDDNGCVTINSPQSDPALTVNGQTLIAGNISNSGNIIFNTDARSLNSVGSTQGPLMKIYGGVGNTGLQGSITLDYTAAGFSNTPIICMNPVNGVSVLLTIKSITNTTAIIMSGSTLNVPFNYIAIGI